MFASSIVILLALVSVNVEVSTLDDQIAHGQLASASSEKIVIRGEQGEVAFPVPQLLAVTPTTLPTIPSTKPTAWIELADGTKLPATNFTSGNGKATIALLSGDKLDLPTRALASVRFRDANSSLEQQWQKIIIAAPQGDAVVLRKGDEGKEFLDYLEGVLHEVTPTALKFEFDDDIVTVKRDKVKLEGLIFYQRERSSSPASVCRIESGDGSHWNAAKFDLSDDAIVGTTSAGAKFSVPLANLRSLDFSAGKIIYLTDLSPQSSAKSFAIPPTAATKDEVQRLWSVGGTKNILGKSLSLGGKPVNKGILLHGSSELVYRLPSEFSRLEMQLGIDDQQGGQGSMRVEIYGDDRRLYEGIVTSGTPPVKLELDLVGVRRLKISADYDQGLDIGDHLILSGARLRK